MQAAAPATFLKSTFQSTKIRRFLSSVLLLTAVSLAMRTILLRFNLYLTDEIGSAGIGLVELILSVYGFTVTFSSAGVSLAASRLSAQELGRESGAGVRAVMRRCLCYALLMSGAAALFLVFASDWIALVWIGNDLAAKPLRYLALGLPAVAITSAVGGYFSAVRRVGKNAFGQLIEMGVRILLTLIFLRRYGSDFSSACIALVFGMTASEVISCLYQLLLYARDMRKHIPKSGELPKRPTRAILLVTLPVAISSYIRSGLITLEHMLIPRGLNKYGKSYEQSLSDYGVLSTMALPILFFPASLLYSANSLLIPEIARCGARNDQKSIERISRTLLRFTVLFGIGTAAILLCFSDVLGRVLYRQEASVGYYLALLAPLVPVMYLDSATDALLKGLGEQIYCMIVNIFDAGISVLLVFFLVPRMGVEGYILVIILSELINAALSISRLSMKVRFGKEEIAWLVVPLICAIGATCITRLACACLLHLSDLSLLLLGGGFCLALYIGFLVILRPKK